MGEKGLICFGMAIPSPQAVATDVGVGRDGRAGGALQVGREVVPRGEEPRGGASDHETSAGALPSRGKAAAPPAIAAMPLCGDEVSVAARNISVLAKVTLTGHKNCGKKR